jgi:hypothetical protein
MLKIKYSLALAVVCSTLTSFPKSTQAQYYYVPNEPVFPDMCGYREAPCRRDRDGNIVDRKTGDVYDRKGHLIRRNDRSEFSSNTTRSRRNGISEACASALESELEGTDRETVESNPVAFGNYIQVLAESLPECRE